MECIGPIGTLAASHVALQLSLCFGCVCVCVCLCVHGSELIRHDPVILACLTRKTDDYFAIVQARARPAPKQAPLRCFHWWAQS